MFVRCIFKTNAVIQTKKRGNDINVCTNNVYIKNIKLYIVKAFEIHDIKFNTI